MLSCPLTRVLGSLCKPPPTAISTRRVFITPPTLNKPDLPLVLNRLRRVRARLLPEGGPRLHPARGRRLHPLRPLVLLDHGLDLSQPPLPVGAQNGGQKSNVLPRRGPERLGLRVGDDPRPRAGARAQVAYYVSDLPVPALYGPRGLDVGAPGVAVLCRRGRPAALPQICFVDPPFRDGGGGDGISADEHPHGDVRLGQAFMSDVVHAFIESPQYRARARCSSTTTSGAGSSTTCARRHVPDDRAQPQDLDERLVDHRVPRPGRGDLAVHAGARKGGRVSHMTCTHESILKLISYRYRLGFLNKRHRYASNIGRSFDFTQARLRAADAARPGGDRGGPVLRRRQRRRPEGARPGRARDIGAARPARLRGPEGHLRLAVPVPGPGPPRLRGRRLSGASVV